MHSKKSVYKLEGVDGVFYPCLPLGPKRPLLLILPGGGYRYHTPLEGLYVSKFFHRWGLHTAVLKYRLSGFPHPQEDLIAALRQLRAQARVWAIDENKIGVLGFSAGGHVASSALMENLAGVAGALPRDWLPNFAVLAYPVVSMREFAHQGSKEALLGKNPPEALERQMSAHLNLAYRTPPVFLWATKADQTVDYRNSSLLEAALKKRDSPIRAYFFEKGRHGLGLALSVLAPPETRKWRRYFKWWLRDIGVLPADGKKKGAGR